MIAETNAPRLMSSPFIRNPNPVLPPPPAALTSGVITLSVNDLIRVLNANATTRPTAITTSSPCIRKFLKPLSTTLLWLTKRVVRPCETAMPAGPVPAGYLPPRLVPRWPEDGAFAARVRATPALLGQRTDEYLSPSNIRSRLRSRCMREPVDEAALLRRHGVQVTAQRLAV